MPTLTVAIIARQAEDNLPRCLESLYSWADELIVVIDSRTTDTTAAIAKKYKARVELHTFINFAQQKNYALSLVKSDWVLFMDADEWLTEKTKIAITTAITKNQFAGFTLPRLNIIFGKPIHHSNWDPNSDTHIWLFKPSLGTWQGAVHEEVVIQGNIGHINQPKMHTPYKDIADFFNKLNIYTTLGAGKFSIGDFIFSPLKDFFRRYLWHRGLLDGAHGFYLAYLMMIYYLSQGVKSWQKKYSPSV